MRTSKQERIRNLVSKRIDPGFQVFADRVLEIRERTSREVLAAAKDLCAAIMAAEGTEIIKIYGESKKAEGILEELAKNAAHASLQAGACALRHMFEDFGETVQ